jgi:GGDEF domain-containing protein
MNNGSRSIVFQPTCAWSNPGEQRASIRQHSRSAGSRLVHWLLSVFGPPVPRLYNSRGFVIRGDDLLRIAANRGRPVTMAVFGFDDLNEARRLYDQPTFRKIVARVGSLLQELASAGGLVAHTGAEEFTVMLPGFDRRQALAAIERVMGRPARVELDICREEILLVPRLELECAGGDTQCASMLHDELRRELRASRASEQHHLDHMARHRSRHSRPMEVAGAGS